MTPKRPKSLADPCPGRPIPGCHPHPPRTHARRAPVPGAPPRHVAVRDARDDFMRLDDYKDRVAATYSAASARYDDGPLSGWHLAIARRLVAVARLAPGQKVLDVATGTGMAALEAARKVGPSGRVVGIDIAVGMIDVARRKAEEQGVRNLELMIGDAEEVEFPSGSFDAVICSSAIIWMDIPRVLRRWRGFLAPGGVMAFHGFSDGSFVRGAAMREVAARRGVRLVFNAPTDTAGECAALAEAAGYADVRVETGQYGEWLPVQEALVWGRPDNPMVEPLLRLDESEMEQMENEYRHKILELATDEGVWDDRTVHFVTGRKIAASC